MSTARSRWLTGLLACPLLAGGCHAPGDRILSYPQYLALEHPTPVALRATLGDSRLLYYGAAHFDTPEDPQALDIESRWHRFKPDFALNEGGDPPVALTHDEAIGRYGEAGLLRWMAHRDGVPIKSLDPTKSQEATALLKKFSCEDLKLFYILRSVMQEMKRAPEYRQPSLEEAVQKWLDYYSKADGLAGPPTTLAEFEQSCRRRVPDLTDWRKVPPEWFDPAPEKPPAFTNTIARASSQFRDRFIVDTLITSLQEHARVFAVVGASHVVMQRPELEARLKGADWSEGFTWDDPGMFLTRSEVAARRGVVSLLGKALIPPEIPDERRLVMERELGLAFARVYDIKPGENDYVWLGRRLAYLYRYDDALQVFTEGLAAFPDSPKLLRHRGHRYLTTRHLDLAVADLQRAARLIESRHAPDEIEPDGEPNRFNSPRSTTNTNIYYHLGLAYYLRGEFDRAAQAYRACLGICPNDDMRVATIHWLYMSLRRAGHDAEATRTLEPIRAHMEIMENDAYFRLCLMYKGLRTPEEATPVDTTDDIGRLSAEYGIANWLWCEGRQDEARVRLQKLSQAPMWPSFAVLAAEADLARTPPPSGRGQGGGPASPER